jgi:quinol monooxygenase YgiN
VTPESIKIINEFLIRKANAGMVIIITKYSVKPDKVGTFKETFLVLAEESRKEKENNDYLLFHNIQEDNVWYTIGRWQRPEAVHEHMTSPHFKKAIADAVAMLTTDPVFSICEEVH